MARETDILNDGNIDTLVDSTIGGSFEEFLDALVKGIEEKFGPAVETSLLDAEKAYRNVVKSNEEKARKEQKKYLQKAADTYAENQAKLEHKYRKKYKDLDAQERRDQIIRDLEEEFKKREELQKKAAEQQKKLAAGKQFNPLDWTTWGSMKESGAGFGTALDGLAHKLGDFTKQLSGTIDTIGRYQGSWDTRLTGSSFNYHGLIGQSQRLGSATTLFRQADLNTNINKAVELGIAYNLEQRAFLETISDKIANTFDAFDSNLLQIIRVQQSDSTAARLGMEANLTNYLNSMFSDSSYLNGTRGSVTNALYEALSLMNNGNLGIDVEYQAQKWLGSLYSVGMSNQSVGSIASALGQLLSGNVSGLNSGSGMLLNMAASKSGLSIADMLINGLDASEMNSLMQSMVEYLQVIANDNHVVQSQYAQVFGLATSDIQAARNLKGSIANIAGYGSGFNYATGVGNLFAMANTMGNRTSMGEHFSNAIDNMKYTLAAGIANSPVMYAIYEIASMLDNVAGGIKIPDFSVMGTGVSLNTSVADLMRIGVLGGSLLSSIGNIASSVGNGNNAANMLSSLGITGNATTMVRGAGLGLGGGGPTESQKNFQGNNDSDNVQSTYESDSNNKRQEVMEENNSESDKTMNDLWSTTDSIYSLLLQLTTIGSGVALNTTSSPVLEPGVTKEPGASNRY